MRFTSAITAVVPGPRLLTAAKKLRGLSCCATSASNSLSPTRSFAIATCSRVCATISRSTAGVSRPPPAPGAPAPLFSSSLKALIVALALTGTTALAAAPIPPAPTPAATPAATSGATLALHTVIFLLAAASLILLWMRDVIRPGSFRRRPPRPELHTQPVPWMFAALLTFLAAGIGAIAAASAVDPETLKGRAILGVTAMGVQLAAAITALLVVSNLARISITTPRPRDALHGLLGIAAALPLTLAASTIAVVLHRLITHQAPVELGHSTLKDLASHRSDIWVWTSVIAAVLLAPIVEELLYRGLVQTGFLAAIRSPWAAILITTTLFTAMHWEAVTHWYGLVPIAILSIALGIAYERTGRILIPIVMHAAFNASNVLLALVLTSKP